MTERPLVGRVAVVTGAARGQGRSHALRLATDGAAVIALDACRPVAAAPYPMPTRADLDETAKELRDVGAEVHVAQVDVRDLDELQAAVDAGADRLGGLDIVVANAGIAAGAPIAAVTAEQWREVVDIDLTGVYNTVKATAPRLVAQGRGGSIILISSSNGGLKAPPNLAAYSAAKHGVVGLARSLAVELGPLGIRVNTVHPTAVDTAMIQNQFTYDLFRPDLEGPRREDVVELFRSFHSLPVPWIEARDVSAAVAFLASDRARCITGIALPVDAGLSAR